MTHTVLLVEDDAELRDSMRDLLEDSGFTVVAAGDGLEALDALARIDLLCLVLLDLLMPRMNGWDFFAKMRQHPEFDQVPVIVHSSAPNRAPTGVTRVLTKPVDPEMLLSIVRDYCAA